MARKSPYLPQTPQKHTWGIILVDLAAKKISGYLVFPKAHGFGQEESQHVLGVFSSKYKFPSYLVVIIHRCPTTSRMQKAISLSALGQAEMPVGLTRTPRTSRFCWCGDSVGRAVRSAHDEAGKLPAALQLPERLPSAQTHWHDTHSLSGSSRFYTARHCC